MKAAKGYLSIDDRLRMTFKQQGYALSIDLRRLSIDFHVKAMEKCLVHHLSINSKNQLIDGGQLWGNSKGSINIYMSFIDRCVKTCKNKMLWVVHQFRK